MNLHADELELASAYEKSHAFEELSPEQTHQVMERGRAMYRWFRAHQHIHNLINGTLILSIFAWDFAALVALPYWILKNGRGASTPWILLAAVISGSIHSWLMYSLSIFSLHEGAAHDLIFSGSGPAGRAARFFARNLCRIAASEPEFYARCHMAHHAKFGTLEDSEFLNFVRPRRYWLTFIPLAAFLNFSDFVIHRPPTFTKSRRISALLAFAYNAAWAYVLYRLFGPLMAFITIAIITPHVGFYVDRLRQFTEHNLMPLENRSGARSFGIGMWGFLVGGGFWGQPCHLAHHLVASIPWYQQIRLHLYLTRIMTLEQRRQFLLEPFTGFPRLLFHIVHEAYTFVPNTSELPSRGRQPG
jgi:Fatty acid desaturase